jgi:hypothetical protein
MPPAVDRQSANAQLKRAGNPTDHIWFPHGAFPKGMFWETSLDENVQKYLICW